MKKLIQLLVTCLFLTPSISFSAQQYLEHGSGVYWGITGDQGEKANYLILDENFTELYLRSASLVTLSGVSENSLNMGVFSGSTLPDNLTTKQLFQTIETALESMAGGHDAVSIGTANGLSLSTQELSLAAATVSTPGAMTATQATKLAGIADGATANSSDSALLDRGNHTGTQLASTISNFQATVTANTEVTANTAKEGLTTGSVDADELASTAVTPGSYVNTSLTVDQDGRITAATNGSSSSALEVEDESVSVDTAVTKLNFLGTAVTAAENADHEIDITVGSASQEAMEYASIYTSANTTATTISAADTWYQLTIFDTDGPEHTVDGDHTTDDVTIASSGDYIIAFNGSMTGTSANLYHVQVYKNNKVIAVPGLYAKVTATGNSQPVSVVFTATLTAADTIEVWVMNDDAANNVTFSEAALSVVRADNVGAVQFPNGTAVNDVIQWNGSAWASTSTIQGLIDDSGTTTSDVWSASKINTEILSAINQEASVNLVTADTVIQSSDLVLGAQWWNDSASARKFTIPNITAGDTGKIGGLTANAITVCPDSSDTFILNGTTGTAGYPIVSTGAVGDLVELTALDTTRIMAYDLDGTWAIAGSSSACTSTYYTLNITQPTNGTISGTGILCGSGGSDCTESILASTPFSMTTAGDTGYDDDPVWSGADAGDVSGSGTSWSITMDADKYIIPTFSATSSAFLDEFTREPGADPNEIGNDWVQNTGDWTLSGSPDYNVPSTDMTNTTSNYWSQRAVLRPVAEAGDDLEISMIFQTDNHAGDYLYLVARANHSDWKNYYLEKDGITINKFTIGRNDNWGMGDRVPLYSSNSETLLANTNYKFTLTVYGSNPVNIEGDIAKEDSPGSGTYTSIWNSTTLNGSMVQDSSASRISTGGQPGFSGTMYGANSGWFYDDFRYEAYTP